MTRADKIIALLEKSDALIEWFKGKPAPVPPIELHVSTTIVDVNQYFKTQLARMECYRKNPFHPEFVSAYYRLLHLKNYMSNGAQ